MPTVKLTNKCYFLPLALIVASCTQTQEVPLTEFNLPNNFVNEGQLVVKDKWWQHFNNPHLNTLVEEALSENLPLKANALRLKADKLDIRLSKATQLPQLNLTGRATSDLDNVSSIDSSNLGLTASWELDLWGKLASQENITTWNFQQAQALFHAKNNTVAGNTSSAWLAVIAEYQKQQILIKQYNRTKAALQVISRRFALGKNSVTNIWQQEKLLKTIEVKQRKNEALLALAKQRLTLWLGRSSEYTSEASHRVLPELPDLPSLGIPLSTLKNRPDITQAFGKVQSANESVIIAMADRFPRLTLRASYATEQNNVTDLFDLWAGDLIASLTLPLFDGKKRTTVVQQKKLQLKALILEYKHTWLAAIAEVNKALINEKQLTAVAENLREQMDLAKKTEKLIAIKYLNNKSNYINLLNAQEDILTLELQLIDADQALLLNRILLYRELSHGHFADPTGTDLSASHKVTRG